MYDVENATLALYAASVSGDYDREKLLADANKNLALIRSRHVQLDMYEMVCLQILRTTKRAPRERQAEEVASELVA